ncbi:unnamed protein product [Prunus brigantina]
MGRAHPLYQAWISSCPGRSSCWITTSGFGILAMAASRSFLNCLLTCHCIMAVMLFRVS